MDKQTALLNMRVYSSVRFGDRAELNVRRIEGKINIEDFMNYLSGEALFIVVTNNQEGLVQEL